MRRTKVLATLGPASRDVDTLVRMMDAGMDAVRINYSHGTAADQEALVAAVRRAAEESGRAIPILQDLQGTKVRIGAVADGSIVLEPDQQVEVRHGSGTGHPGLLYVDDPRIVSGVGAGGSIVLGDGEVVLQVETAEGEHLMARVASGGRVRSGAGITAPGVPLPGGLTEKDHRDLEAGIALGLDYVALSFVQSGAEVEAARRVRDELGGDMPIISKIERTEALDDLDAIITASDGILVARGDLGIALAPEEVPIAQKRILARCAHAGRLSITATQMLESMVASPRPTRAEASDVANAILDGTSVVMLSGETAVGQNPVATVRMMCRIARRAEEAMFGGTLDAPVHRGVSEGNVADAIALACAVTAEDLDARAIVAFTQTGMSAHRVAKHRPRVPIIAATPDPVVERRLGLLWGVTAMLVPEAASLDDMVHTAERAALERGLVASGDLLVVTGGDIGVPGSTNLLRVSAVR